ncbi:MAG: 4-hydroxy-tetrahydrodipicolinate synthase [Fermentimonas sp.]|jgi:4-hydroxy-tetrahydrodipicolinate synthase|nr:4-hydroxy-tetrahydrodipicolinate synthase [Fermentimonas sp.]NLC86514.1 4-hydroxy-tetrahydrodipicolinate synthase [Bacteroidales bacterium]HBT85158.1 4-hydroxy-tetrahydrodipicolinate synthase [Porphyromonadaceae bacterium]MDD2930529.1 4-hydroxy-tetrahydrodipicolinate synthase [Fermentimonas sp.]MDD3188234.1 4-hydroxy-tetrahydrodipicolinate synthase [Fermentimonas sp.]
MTELNLRGLGVALITPFNNDGSVDFEALSRLIDFQLDNGTNYIVALGTTAETPTLSMQEKKEVSRFIVNIVNGRVPVVLGIGGNNTAALVEELKTTDFKGISAILSVAPYYNKPTQEGLYQHYKALSEASPLPIILYNVPGRTGVNITSETTLRIANDCRNVIAIKEASGNLGQIEEIIKGAPEGFSVISGDDAVTTAVIELGGIGVISVFGNAFPKEMAWLVDSALRGDSKNAREKMEADFSDLFHLIFVEGNPAGVKSILSQKGMIINRLRLPLVPVSEKTSLLIKEALSNAKYI